MPNPSINNEKALLLKVAKGDENAFSQLFKMHYNQLGDFIIRITQSQILAEEIVQDVFLKIWIRRSTLIGINCFKAYLMVVARNHTYNCLKQLARENNRKKEWVNSLLQMAANNLEETSDAPTSNLIDEAIELLPPQQKKVYILSRKEDMKQQDIARKLNISLETVKKHMVLALRFLKNHLRTHLDLFFLVMICCYR